MKTKKLSKRIQNIIIQKYQSGNGYKKISGALKISRTSVRTVIGKWKENSSAFSSWFFFFWYIYLLLELWAHWATLFPCVYLPCPALTVCHSLSDGRHPEYTEVPLGALDIAAADSLTLSPHNGKFKMDVWFLCFCPHLVPHSQRYETKLQYYCLFKAPIIAALTLLSGKWLGNQKKCI